MASDSDDSRSFGFLLAELRRERSLSQLALALDAGVSARHVSFLESGRSTPSRIMVMRLAEAVGASLDTRNRLLLAAGYAPAAAPLAGLRTGAGGLAAQLRNIIELALDMQSMTLEEAAARSRAALSDVGFRWFHAGVVTRGKSPDSGPAILLHEEGFPHVAWLAHNLDNGHCAHDPLVRATLERHHPFFWEDVLGDFSGLAKRERGIFDEAKEFQVHSGFVAPIRRGDGSVIAISCMGDDSGARNSSTRLAARVICTALLEKFEDPSAQTAPMAERPALKPEARDLLRWVLAGRDLAWIAERAGKPEHAVSEFAGEACASLGATDLLQGALRAHRYRLLQAA